MSYPTVKITNGTSFVVTGTIEFASCSSHDYSVNPHEKWVSPSRGLCLLKKVSAQVNVNGQIVTAKPYTSSGTSYSRFAIMQDNGEYYVARLVSDVEGEEE